MSDEIVFGDHMTNILVHKEGGLVYIWTNQWDEKPRVLFMTHDQYVEMVKKMVKIANEEEK